MTFVFLILDFNTFLFLWRTSLKTTCLRDGCFLLKDCLLLLYYYIRSRYWRSQIVSCSQKKANIIKSLAFTIEHPFNWFSNRFFIFCNTVLMRPYQVETAIHRDAIHGLQFRLYRVVVPFSFLCSSQPFFDVIKKGIWASEANRGYYTSKCRHFSSGSSKAWLLFLLFFFLSFTFVI